MYRLFLILSLCIVELSATKLELLTGEFVRDGNLTVAKGGVTIFGKGIFISSDKAVFHNKSNKLELFGNVIIKRENNTEALVDYLSFNIKSNRALVDNVLLPGQRHNIWLLAESAESYEKIYHLTNLVSSSCDPASPDWSIRASHGEYSGANRRAHLYNPRFYAGRVPVFYLPYITYPTDNRRRTGLLFPKFGTSQLDGLFYEQPLYIAPYDQWDLELIPQHRSQRGNGLIANFRFVDSPHSSGEILYGSFVDKDSFVQENSLQEKKHTGLRLNYRSNQIFTSGKAIDKLYFKWEEYSDVEFLNLESTDTQASEDIDQIITNEINYYYKLDDLYVGLYGRYFIDVLDPDRKDLLQIYPDVNLHKMTDSIFLDELLYSVDVRYKNFTREVNTTASSKRLTTPISYAGTLFSDFLNYQITQSIDLFRVDYTDPHSQISDDYGSFLSTSTRLALFTNLTKPYGTGFHGMNFSLSYMEPGEEKVDGDLNDDFVTFNKEKSSYDFKFSQYFYGLDYEDVLVERINQSYQESSEDNWTLTNLEHELIYKPKPYLTLSNKIIYSHESKALVDNASSVALESDLGNITLSYLTGKDPVTLKKNKDYYRLHFLTQFDGKNSLGLNYEYDNLDKEPRKISLAYRYDKDCWGYSLELSRQEEPVATSTGATSRTNDIIFFKVNVKPLGQHHFQMYENERS